MSCQQITGFYYVQDIDRIKTADNQDVKWESAEIQRLKNRFASYEVHIGHFFMMSMLLSFYLTRSIFRFKKFSLDYKLIN